MVNIETGEVVAIVVADPEQDTPHAGCRLVQADSPDIRIGWLYSDGGGFEPSLAEQQQITAEALDLEEEGLDFG